MGQSPFQPKQKLQSPNEHFLSLTICPDNNKMYAQVFVPSSLALNKWASDLIKVASAQPENILIPREYKIVQKSPCGEGVTLQIEFECYYIPLSHEISKRCDCEKYLEETEMWYLLFCLTESAVCCQGIGEKIGDINPQNILLNNSGKLKLISRLSVPNYCDPINNPHKKNVYFSPQELEIIKKSFKDCPLDCLLTQSFSIGMTMLSAGTLQDLVKCYDYQKAELNKIQFNKILNFWQQNEFYSQFQKKKTHYSPRLKSMICGLVQLNPAKRQTSQQVYNILKPYKAAIMKMEPFDMDLKKLSPFKNVDSISKKEKPEVIHILRSNKKNQSKFSPTKPDESYKFDKPAEMGLQFSFGSPETNKSTKNKSSQETTAPLQKLKLVNFASFRKRLQHQK